MPHRPAQLAQPVDVVERVARVAHPAEHIGGFAVLLAVPLAAVLVTLVDVVVRGRDPSKEDVPTVLFPTKDVGT